MKIINIDLLNLEGTVSVNGVDPNPTDDPGGSCPSYTPPCSPKGGGSGCGSGTKGPLLEHTSIFNLGNN